MPLRARVTLAYVGAVAIALIATAVVVHAALAARFVDGIDEALETRATVTARLAIDRGRVDPGLTDGLDDPGESFTQVIGPGEELLSSTPGLPLRPLLDEAGRRTAFEGRDLRLRDVPIDASDDPTDEIDVEALEETGTEPFETDEARVLARLFRIDGAPHAVIVGVTYEDREEALADLRGVLFWAIPAALLLVALAGSGAIRAALRPVERMRARAAGIEGPTSGEQLPVPPGDDELARLGHTLNAMLGRIDTAVARERELVADVSHELRTPLAVIAGELELALAARPDVEVAASVRVAREEAERLARLGEDLLLLARADQDRLRLRVEPLEARALLESARRRFAARQAAIEVEAPADLVVEGDRLRLDQALGNLVDNALRHGAPPVRLWAARNGAEVVLGVRDSGPGFPEEFVDRAFERFSQAARGRSGEGTGLGLAIARLVATAHGGRAEAANAPGGGAEVRIALPGVNRA